MNKQCHILTYHFHFPLRIKPPKFSAKLRRLQSEGILDDALLDHLWHDILHIKPALVRLMERFDLLYPQNNSMQVYKI